MTATYYPMLATNLSDAMGNISPSDALVSLARAGDFLFDVKWDGVRCIARITRNEVTLTNRNGKNINERYPDVLATLADAFPGGGVVLDGEIVVFNEQGKPDFGLVSRRDRVGSEAKAREAAERLPATFVVFDLLEHEGTDLTDTAYLGRRELLQYYVSNGPGLVVSPASPDGETMWAFVQEQALEGLIAKRINGTYRAGRNPTWVKLKDVKRVSCVVTSMEEGKGKHEGKMGKLHIALYDGTDDLVPVGKVGTGFTDAHREQWWANRDAWSKGLTVVEVEYLNVTEDGVLRFPSFKGIRMDVHAGDCTTDQLT